jgi:GDPmannose 4,6-dehydratase
MLQQDQAQDSVIATGTTITLEDFLQAAFTQADLNWTHYVEQDPGLFRPADMPIGRADPAKAYRELNWKAATKGADVVKKMYQLTD